MQRTLSIIKPDATKRNLTGLINAKFENAGLKIIAQKKSAGTKRCEAYLAKVKGGKKSASKKKRSAKKK